MTKVHERNSGSLKFRRLGQALGKFVAGVGFTQSAGDRAMDEDLGVAFHGDLLTRLLVTAGKASGIA